MIRTHVRGVEFSFDPTKSHGIPQSPRDVFLVRAVRIHLQNAGATFFLLFTGVATAADCDVDLSIATDNDGARQMPASVFVSKSVSGKGRQHLRLACRRVFACFITITDELIG